jgi:hypothetical protein
MKRHRPRHRDCQSNEQRPDANPTLPLARWTSRLVLLQIHRHAFTIPDIHVHKPAQPRSGGIRLGGIYVPNHSRSVGHEVRDFAAEVGDD